MKHLILLFLLFSSKILLGQFAIISDKDGWCNIRSSEKIANNIQDKLNNGHLVYCYEKRGNWVNADYSKSGNDKNGYVYFDRLKYVSDYTKIPLTIETVGRVVLSKDSISIILSKKRFDKTNKQLTYNKEYKDVLEKINGKKIWGTDGETPKSEYLSVEMYLGKRKISLPPPAFADLYEPNLVSTEANYDPGNDILYIHAGNSDGAGYYEVIWKIEKGVYKERLVVSGF